MRISAIVKASAIVFGVEMTEITGPRRSKHLVTARQVAMYVAAKHTDASLPEIGRYIGNRDHTTVLHGVRRMDARVASGLAAAYRISEVRDLAERLDASWWARMKEATTTPASQIAAKAPSSAAERNSNPAAPSPPEAIEIAVSDKINPVSDPVETLAGMSLSREPVGSRVWCEIQNARFFRAMGVPYAPSVRVVKIGGVARGI